jgi:hypothetical protein
MTFAIKGRLNLTPPSGGGSGGGTDWDTYTPDWTAGASAVTIGDGVIEGFYRLQTNPNGTYTVDVAVWVYIGSTTSIPGGDWQFSMPTATLVIGVSSSVGSALMNLGGNIYAGVVTIGDVGGWGFEYFTVYAPVLGTQRVAPLANGQPETWSSGSILQFAIRYHAAHE